MKNLIANLLFFSTIIHVNAQGNSYNAYHQKVIRCEQLITERKIEEALNSLAALFKEFDFVFLREYQLATELSLHEQNFESAFGFLRLGIQGGWTMKSIKKSKSIKQLRSDPRWKNLEDAYDSLRKIYVSTLNIPLREEAHAMLRNDQKIALKVFLRIGEKSKAKYAMKEFAPYSEKTMTRINEILSEYGYPGEKLIGNSWWTSVNISHHNSFHPEYTLNDTLYLNMRPKLENAVAKGELHPKDYAIMEDWRNAVIHHHEKSLYGFLGKIPDDSELSIVNKNRKKLGIRSIELRNNLIDIEKETGLNLYLPKSWQKGKITVKNKQS